MRFLYWPFSPITKSHYTALAVFSNLVSQEPYSQVGLANSQSHHIILHTTFLHQMLDNTFTITTTNTICNQMLTSSMRWWFAVGKTFSRLFSLEDWSASKQQW